MPRLKRACRRRFRRHLLGWVVISFIILTIVGLTIWNPVTFLMGFILFWGWVIAAIIAIAVIFVLRATCIARP